MLAYFVGCYIMQLQIVAPIAKTCIPLVSSCIPKCSHSVSAEILDNSSLT